MSALEELLAQHIKLTGLPVPAREYRFHPRHRWRFDFAWPRYKIAVEVDGEIYCRGRHVRGAGFERDAEKRNAAVMAGWRVLHFTPRQVKSGTAVQSIETLINARPGSKASRPPRA
jgi:very-short-patch-repair endonuclease